MLLLDFDPQRKASACLAESGQATVAAQTAAHLLQEVAIELPAGEFVLVPGANHASMPVYHLPRHVLRGAQTVARQHPLVQAPKFFDDECLDVGLLLL